ncbi:hypothetical protein OQA88_4693 [Cercophora sp. LCS_1]
MATISIGGNDGGFGSVLKNCLYRGFFPQNCDKTLEQAMENIANLREDLSQLYGDILDAAQRAGAPPQFTLFVTGYATFFNEHTLQCDTANMHFWKWLGKKSFLTKEIRWRMNGMVRGMNKIIQEAVMLANWRKATKGRIVFVSIDEVFEGHRFCEEGVTEPDRENPNILTTVYSSIMNTAAISSASRRGEKPAPLDLSHHYSDVCRRRVPSKIKEAYKLFQIPGIKNLAGGLPNLQFFPFDTLEAQAAKPERWTPSPNYPENSRAIASSSKHTEEPTHVTVPKASSEHDPVKRIDLATALQYGLAQGYPPLLDWVREFTCEYLHPSIPYQGGLDVAMTCGSTDGFAKSMEMFVNPWNEERDDIRNRPGILCERFVYGTILGETGPRGVQTVPVEADTSGMLVTGPGGLEDILANWDSSKGKRPHLMYTVTQGHNPTGVVLTLKRKREIYAVCSKYDVIIIEDEPYWYLQFPSAGSLEAESRNLPTPASPTPTTYSSTGYPFLDSLTPSFITLDTDGRVVRLDTFSKTVAPGCRLGWMTAQPALIERYVRVSETSTQQPSGFVQSLVASLIMGPNPVSPSPKSTTTAAPSKANPGWKMSGWIRWLEGLRGMYERRMARMCRIIDAGSHLITSSSSSEEWDVISKTRVISFKWPRGGMFIWLRVYFEKHALFGTVGGKVLSTALTMYLTTKPYLVVVASGWMFSATDAIREAEGWRYYRLCFAAEAEENIDLSAKRFVEGVHGFWGITSVEEIRKLVDLMPHAAT